MPDFDRLKNMIESEVQALEDRAQVANDLTAAFKEDGWDENVINFLETYHGDIIEYRNRLSELFAHITQREEEAQAARANPVSVLAQIAARLEEVGGRLTASVGTLQESVQLFQGVVDYAREAASTLEPGDPASSATGENSVPPDPTQAEDPPQDPGLWSKS